MAHMFFCFPNCWAIHLFLRIAKLGPLASFGGVLYLLWRWVNRAQWFLSRYTENVRSSFCGGEDKLKANNFQPCLPGGFKFVFSAHVFCLMVGAFAWCFCRFRQIEMWTLEWPIDKILPPPFLRTRIQPEWVIATFEMPWGRSIATSLFLVFMVAVLRFHLRIQAQPKTIGIWWDFL